MTSPYLPGGFCHAFENSTAIFPTNTGDSLGEQCGKSAQEWLEKQGFRAKAGSYCVFPDQNQKMCIALGVTGASDWRSWADAAINLPSGQYHTSHVSESVLRGWGSGSYRYGGEKACPQLCCPTPDHRMLALVRAERLTRFLIDHPANKLTTARLAKWTKRSLLPLAPTRIDSVRELVGEELLQQNFPLIHTVGRASDHAPRLLAMAWRSPDQNLNAPLITLVGKGVCFDTGGLDIKPRSAMLNMKKDMGGAAHTVGLAAMVLSAGLNVRLRLILGIAENSISGNAMRPGDILRARNGTSIEVGDTDAEGRLILADCLSLASEEKSALLIDFATLTGAARVALGTDLPAVFCNDDDIAKTLCAKPDDPLWRMPLHKPYASEVSGQISTLNSAPASGYGGAITAALFLEHFVPQNTPWAHIDLMAMAPKKIHGRAAGAAAQGIYACFAAIQELAE